MNLSAAPKCTFSSSPKRSQHNIIRIYVIKTHTNGTNRFFLRPVRVIVCRQIALRVFVHTYMENSGILLRSAVVALRDCHRVVLTIIVHLPEFPECKY